MRNYYYSLYFTLTHLLSLCFLGQVGLLNYLLFGLCSVFYFIFLKGYSLSNNLGSLFFLFYLNFSFFLAIPLGALLDNQKFSGITVFYGSLILASSCVLIPFLNKVFKKQRNVGVILQDNKIFNLLNLTFAVVAFGLSVLCYKLGITKMGVVHTVLPYKLEPFLNILRNAGIPFLSLIIIDQYISQKNKKMIFISLLTFALWLILETWIKGSRGTIILGLLPIFLLIIKKNILKKYLVVLALSFVVLTPSLYVVGNMIRSKNMSTNYSVANVGGHLWGVYNRIFHDSVLFDKIRPYSENKFFKSNFDLIRKYDGAVKFHTQVIDNVPVGTPHSSGITGFVDSYLIGGGILMLLTGLIFHGLYLLLDFKIIPIFNISDAMTVNIYMLLFSFMYNADGFWTFFLFRSPFTIMMPILFIIGSYLYLKLIHQASNSERAG